MNNAYLLIIFWVVILVWLLISFSYWYAIRPYLCDNVRFNLFSLRDELRKIEFSDNSDNSDDFCFRFMENVLNTGIHTVDHVSVGAFLEYTIIHKSSPNDPELRDVVKNIKKFESEASENLKELDRNFSEWMFRAMVANSPWYCFFAKSFGFLFKLSNSNNPIIKFKKQSRDLVHFRHIPV